MASFCRSRIVVTKDDAGSIYWIERDAKPALFQINADLYEVRQGRCLLGVVMFYNGDAEWGWRFFPRQPGQRPSRKLHSDPEQALKRRFTLYAIYTTGRLGKLA